MAKIQLLALVKKPAFILSLICLVFFLKGVFLATLFPFINGQDEGKHYNTVQFIAEPAEKNWITNSKIQKIDQGQVETYNFTGEIQETAKAINYNNIRHKLYNTQNFTSGYLGSREDEISSKIYSQVNKDYPPAQVKKPHLYHYIGARIEKIFSEDSIFTRFFLVRIYSVIIGLVCIFLFYFIAKNAGFSPKNSLLISAIAAFQPTFSETSSFITYDIPLIFAFTLFTLAGVLILKKGINWKNLTLLAVSLTVGLMVKVTAVVMVGAAFFLFLYIIYRRSKNKKKFIISAILAFVIFAIIAGFIITNYLNLSKFIASKSYASIGEAAKSLDKYIDKSFGTSRMRLTSKTYWGNFSFIRGELTDNITSAIWCIQTIAAIGFLLFFIFKKKQEFLPDKKYIIFFLVMILVLQFGIRFADWKIWEKQNSVELATSGRYFLPNLISHLMLVATGIGYLLRKEKFLEIFLALALIAMFTFSAYLIFIGMIPRYYF